MEGEGHQQVNGYYTEEDKTAFTDEEDYNDEDYAPEVDEAASNKRQKRHTLEQIRELKAVYDQCAHPDERTKRALGERIGLETSQVKYWFQNHRCHMQAKARAKDNKMIHRETAALLSENASLRQAMMNNSCLACGGATVPAELPAENRRLLLENARLKDEFMRAAALLNQILSSAAPPPPPVTVAVDRRRPAALLSFAAGGDGGRSRAERLRGHAEAAMEQFMMLATKGEPLWLPTPDGEALSYLGCQKRAVPVNHGFRPEGFQMEASRATGIVRAEAPELITMLNDPKRWAEMFPGIVANATTRNDVAISPVHFGSCIQLMNAELHVQSPHLLNRSIKFLRYTKRVASGKWAVVDVSVDGILGPPLVPAGRGSRIADAAVASINTHVPAWYTGCRLLPSGCLVEHMDNGCCMITWVVHAEYDETTVPITFRPLFRSGKAFGANRWLASLQRECEYLAVLYSTQFPRGDEYTAAAISSMGKKGVLELAQRMMKVFYSAVSGPAVTQKSSNINEWPVTVSVGTGGMKTDAAVRMVTWKQAGSVSDLVLSASTTVWLPNIPPQLVFQYLCDDRHRHEWDALANGAAVKELCSVATGQLLGNSVYVLYSNVANAANNKKMLILQQTCTDASGSMVVYAPVEEDSMRAVMNGGDHASVFLMPSGFAILPDGHSSNRGRHAPSSSRAPVGRNNTAGSLLTMACQALLLDSSPTDNHAKAFDDVGKLLRRALKKIKDAVRANVVVPA